MNTVVNVVNLNPTAGALAILPEILLTILAAAVILLDVFWPRSRRREIGLISAVGLGVIALVAMMPLIAVQIMGIIFKVKTSRREKSLAENASAAVTEGDGR